MLKVIQSHQMYFGAGPLFGRTAYKVTETKLSLEQPEAAQFAPGSQAAVDSSVS